MKREGCPNFLGVRALKSEKSETQATQAPHKTRKPKEPCLDPEFPKTCKNPEKRVNTKTDR